MANQADPNMVNATGVLAGGTPLGRFVSGRSSAETRRLSNQKLMHDIEKARIDKEAAAAKHHAKEALTPWGGMLQSGYQIDADKQITEAMIAQQNLEQERLDTQKAVMDQQLFVTQNLFEDAKTGLDSMMAGVEFGKMLDPAQMSAFESGITNLQASVKATGEALNWDAETTSRQEQAVLAPYRRFLSVGQDTPTLSGVQQVQKEEISKSLNNAGRQAFVTHMEQGKPIGEFEPTAEMQRNFEVEGLSTNLKNQTYVNNLYDHPTYGNELVSNAFARVAQYEQGVDLPIKLYIQSAKGFGGGSPRKNFTQEELNKLAPKDPEIYEAAMRQGAGWAIKNETHLAIKQKSEPEQTTAKPGTSDFNEAQLRSMREAMGEEAFVKMMQGLLKSEE